jgi:DNA-binding NarL/FixJ family response regulator
MAAHPLRGRGDVWQQISDTVRRTGPGERCLIILDGPPGAGKSRLLREVLDAAHHSGCVTIDGHTWRPPPVVEPADLVQLDVRADTGLALVAWDDDATLDAGFVQTWARAAALPVVVLATRRTGSRHAPPFETGSNVTVHIGLAPLPAPAVADLVADRLGATPSTALLELVAAAGGNPGSVVALLDDLRAEALLDLNSVPVRPVRSELPGRTRHRIAERMAQASAIARHLIQVTATVPRGASVPDLAALMRRGPASLVPAVEEALGSGLLVDDGTRLLFPHELVRYEVVKSLPASLQEALCPNRPAPAPTVAPPTAPRPIPGWDRLSDRQREVAVLAGEALTNRQIAERLFVALNTVKFHLRQIFRELGISSRIQLVRLMGR